MKPLLGFRFICCRAGAEYSPCIYDNIILSVNSQVKYNEKYTESIIICVQKLRKIFWQDFKNYDMIKKVYYGRK